MFNNTPKSPKVFKIIRVFAIWVLFIPLAILNGAVREKVLIPLLGMQVALPLSGVLLSGIILLTTYLLFPWLKVSSARQCWIVGVIWWTLTVTFEFGFGHFAMGKPWWVLLQAYDVTTGNLWAVVLFVVLVSPRLASKLRHHA